MSVDLSKYIKSIKIESTFLPTIDIQDPFKPGPPNPLLQILKPKITVEVAQLGDQVMAPYGEPGQSVWPTVRNALLIAGVLFLARKLLK